MRGLIALTCLLGVSTLACAPSTRAPRTRTSLTHSLPTHTPRQTRLLTANEAPLEPHDVSSERRFFLGNSVEGRPLTLTIFGHGSPAVFILGGIHGDEPNSAVVAEVLIAHLRENPSLYAGRTIGILPAANPDGLVRRQRGNAHNVDLNRNFPAVNWQASPAGLSHGYCPSSEPETWAIRKAIRLLEPACIVSIHAISGGRECNNYDGPARVLAELMSGYNGYPATASIGYPTPGSLDSWTGIDQQIPTITLELPKGESGRQSWKQNRGALLALIRATDRQPQEGHQVSQAAGRDLDHPENNGTKKTQAPCGTGAPSPSGKRRRDLLCAYL